MLSRCVAVLVQAVPPLVPTDKSLDPTPPPKLRETDSVIDLPSSPS